MTLLARSTVKHSKRHVLMLRPSRAIASSTRQWDWIRLTQTALLPGTSNINWQVDHNSEPYEISAGLAAEFEDPLGNKLGITDYKKKSELSNQSGDFLLYSS